MDINNCKCGSNNTRLEHGVPCDFGYIRCLDCGNTSKSRETDRTITEQWNLENSPKDSI